MKTRCIVPWAVLVFAYPMLTGCDRGPAEESTSDRVVGVKIYDQEGDLTALFDEWRELGINTAFVSASLHAKVEFRTLADRKGISTFIIIPVFFNPEALEQDTGLYAITDRGERAVDEWVRFVCPSREEYRKQQIERIKTYVSELDPDGLSIDFIRHFVFWEKVYPDRDPASMPTTCFDSHCLRRFEQATGISLPDVKTPEAAAWIKEHHLPAWTDWRSGLTTSMIEEIVLEVRRLKPDILINVHAVPWRENDFAGAAVNVAGQDFARIAPHVDFLSPMTYAHMVKREPSWVHSVVENHHRQTGAAILPSIQVKEAYLETPLSVATFRASLEEALKPPSRGVVFWSWEALEQDEARKAAVREILCQGL